VEAEAKRGRLALIAGPEGSGAAVTIHQDARIYSVLLDGDESVTHALAPGRRAYVHVARGSVELDGVPLSAGDAARIEDVAQITLGKGAGAEVLVFELN
jgi:redox-sensitive bicupin YhaK (pirin superfamily)